MSVSLDEFLEIIKKEHPKEDAVRIELAIDGIFWREPDTVIARYSRLPRKTIEMMRKNIQMDNPGKDYFTI